VNCPNCGSSNLDNASICANCGRSMSSAPPPPTSASYLPPPRPSYGAPPSTEPIPNYLIQSILVTLCCCLPLGVVAIIFAAQVNSKLAAGDVAGAREASANAKKFCWIALILGIVAICVSMLINGAAFLEAFREGMARR
jgi:interferon-induced transmembrane protein/zinc ribbon protein